MKKILNFVFVFFLLQSVNAFVIESLDLTPINVNDLNIHLKVFHYDTFDFDSSNYSINGNVITLEACYDLGVFTESTELENDFVIPNVNLNINNYTLIINIHSFNYSTFCNGVPDDTITVTFQTPIVQSLNFLSSTRFENTNYSDLIVYPIPFETKINISTQTQNIYLIEFFDIKGLTIQCFDSSQIKMSLDLSNFKSGIYLMRITTDKGVVVKKVFKI